MALKLKKNDRVEVITGKYKGTVSRVLFVEPEKGRLAVENVNIVKRHTRARSQQQKGGIVEKEATIHASNCLLYCDKCKRGVRFGARVNEDGSKDRVCKRCDSKI